MCQQRAVEQKIQLPPTQTTGQFINVSEANL